MIVNEVNTAPVLASIADRNASVGVAVNIPTSATDVDTPPNLLAFSLLSPPTPPVGASIGSSSGLFTWRPGAAYSDTTNVISVRVADNGVPVLSATQSFKIMVGKLSPVVLTPRSGTRTNFVLSMTGDAGPDYTFNFSTNLSATNWTALLTTNLAISPLIISNAFPSGEPQRYYRVTVRP